jgi:DNA polymerase I-like protein with 3'-5' exonuclease and polymerase domains/uracil-DNA glycosylase
MQTSDESAILTASGPAWSCALCVKPATWCHGCPREQGCKETPYHFVDGRIQGQPDIILIAEAPVVPRITSATEQHKPFADDAGKLVTRALESVRGESEKYKNLQIAKTYAVLCTSNQGDKDPPKGVLDRCKAFLHQGLEQVVATGKKPVLIAMGMSAVKALGIKAAKLKDVQGRILSGVQVGEHTYDVIITISTKQLIAMAGMYATFYNDIKRAFEVCVGDAPVQVPLSELTKDYIFPKTVQEVREVCEMIQNYSENGKPPETWSISFDTETNTKFAHRAKLKALCVSFSWATGKACAIPLWHKDTPYDPQLVMPYIQAVLESKKPKTMHHGKFDLKVARKLGFKINNWVWDTMLGEHALEEDKKGQYGLKELTKRFFPQFAGYADYLHELLEKLEGDSQLDNLRKAEKVKQDAELESLTGFKKGKKAKALENDRGFEDLPLETLLPYAAIDTDITRRLSLNQMVRIVEEEKKIIALKKVQAVDRYRPFPIPSLVKTPMPTKAAVVANSVPTAKVLSEMEYDGVPVDRDYLAGLQKNLTKVIDAAEANLYKMAGRGPDDLKLKSGAAIANILFSEGFIHPETGKRTFYPPVIINGREARTDKGQLQTTEKVMKFLVAAYKCPFSSQKLIFSKAVKARDTFCRNVWDLSSLDSRLHTNYNQHGTCTFRLSSNDENMQNIPKKLAGYSIKKVFTTTDDSMVFVNADGKSAEVKIFTAYSGDEALAASLNAGQDTHSFFASAIVEEVRRTSQDAEEVLRAMNLTDDQGRDSYRLTYEDFAAREDIKLKNAKYGEILDKFRTAVKRVVFGILYGAGAKKIAETIGISKDQAQAIIDMLFRLFPSIPAYMERTKWEMRTFGYVETFFGHRRRFAVKGATNYLRSRAERQCVNFKIQSTSSDIVMGRLVACRDPLVHDLKGRLLLTVHDSIGFEIPKKYITQLPDFVDRYLNVKRNTLYPWLPVDFSWDFEVGPSYGELQPYKAYIQNDEIKDIINAAEEAYSEEDIEAELSSDED